MFGNWADLLLSLTAYHPRSLYNTVKEGRLEQTPHWKATRRCQEYSLEIKGMLIDAIHNVFI
jgi:hypothetical protein